MTLQNPAVNDVFPGRPNYQPPNFGALAPTAAQAAAKRFDGEPAAVADATIRAADTAFRAHLGAIDPDDYSASGLRQQIQGFTDTDAYQAIAPAVQAVNDAADAATAAVGDGPAGLATDGDAAQELRNTRYLDDVDHTLGAAKDGSQLMTTAQGLVASASPDQLGVLATSLKARLQSRGVASTDWLDAAFTNAAPALASATADQVVANKAAQVVNYNANALAQRISQTQTPFGYRPPNFVDLSVIR